MATTERPKDYSSLRELGYFCGAPTEPCAHVVIRLGNPVGDGSSGQIFHDQKSSAGVFPIVSSANDVRMVQSKRQFNFPRKPLPRYIREWKSASVKQFDRNVSTIGFSNCEKNRADSSLVHKPSQDIGTQPSAQNISPLRQRHRIGRPFHAIDYNDTLPLRQAGRSVGASARTVAPSSCVLPGFRASCTSKR